MLQVNGALATLLVPTFTKLLLNSKTATPWRFTSIMTVLAALYAPLLVLLGPQLNRWLYRGAYPADAATWWALGLVPACGAFFASLRAFCMAREQPRLPLVATIVSALSCLTLGIALCAWRPLLGAGLAMLLGFALQAGVLAWLVRAQRSAL
jgi:O-antigen/teichoic acid export membrane protein